MIKCNKPPSKLGKINITIILSNKRSRNPKLPMQWAMSSNLSEPKKTSAFPFTWHTMHGKPKHCKNRRENHCKEHFS